MHRFGPSLRYCFGAGKISQFTAVKFYPTLGILCGCGQFPTILNPLRILCQHVSKYNPVLMVLMPIKFPCKYLQAWHLNCSDQGFSCLEPRSQEVRTLFLWVSVCPRGGKPRLGLESPLTLHLCLVEHSLFDVRVRIRHFLPPKGVFCCLTSVHFKLGYWCSSCVRNTVAR